MSRLARTLTAFGLLLATTAAAPAPAPAIDPRLTPVAEAMRTLLPADYALLTARLGGLTGTAALKQGAAFFTERLDAHRKDFEAAPDGALAAAAKADAAFAQALRDQDVAVCVAYSEDLDVSQRLSDRSLAAAGNLYIAKLKAIRAGMDAPVARPPFTEADLTPWLEANIQMFGRLRTLQALDPEWIKTASPAELCDTGVESRVAVTALKDELAARVFLRLSQAPNSGFGGMRRADGGAAR